MKYFLYLCTVRTDFEIDKKEVVKAHRARGMAVK